MSHFGERLRQARESQGLSLAQAAIETRILQPALAALEEGAFDRLPNDIVIKGFITNYSNFLGLPAEEMNELYRRERGKSKPIHVAPTSTLVAKRSYVLPSFFGVFFVTIMLVGLTYAVLSAVGHVGNPYVAMEDQTMGNVVPTPTALPPMTDEPPAPPVAAVDPTTNPATNPAYSVATEAGEIEQSNQPNQPASSDAISPTLPIVAAVEDDAATGEEFPSVAGFAPARSEPTASTPNNTPIPSLAPALNGAAVEGTPVVPSVPSPTVPPAPTMAPPATPSAPIVADLGIAPGDGESWLRVTVDGMIVYEGIMSGGQREVFEAQRSVHIRAGNPPVVLVGVNGMQPEPLGAVPGRPVNWSWPPQ